MVGLRQLLQRLLSACLSILAPAVCDGSGVSFVSVTCPEVWLCLSTESRVGILFRPLTLEPITFKINTFILTTGAWLHYRIWSSLLRERVGGCAEITLLS